LSPGTLKLFELFADFKVEVYPSHRSMRYDQWFIDNTLKNATTAYLCGDVTGDKVCGEADGGWPYQGIPFPIPSGENAGYQVMWNYKFSFAPPISLMRGHSYMGDSSGGISPLPAFYAYYMHPWSQKGGSLREKTF